MTPIVARPSATRQGGRRCPMESSRYLDWRGRNHLVGPASTKDFIGVDHANIGVRRRRSPYRRDFCADLSAFNREG